MSKLRHVVCGGTIPGMLRLSTDHMHRWEPEINDLVSTLRNLLRREAVLFRAGADALKEQGFVVV